MILHLLLVSKIGTGVNFCHCLVLPSIRAFSGFLLKSGVKKRHFAEMAKIVFAQYQGVLGFLGSWHGVCIYNRCEHIPRKQKLITGRNKHYE